VLRGYRVILDRDLAAVYGVRTNRFNEAIRRNALRFPPDFMFRLTAEETCVLVRSQIATASQKRRNVRFAPFAFTEHGAIQAANVVNSTRAIAMGVHVVRAFVQLRELVASDEALAQKLDELERKYRHHDKAIAAMLSAVRLLMQPPASNQRGIGFTADLE